MQRAVYSKLKTKLHTKLNQPPQAPEAHVEANAKCGWQILKKKIGKKICIVTFLW
jgi:hypothetical protein